MATSQKSQPPAIGKCQNQLQADPNRNPDQKPTRQFINRSRCGEPSCTDEQVAKLELVSMQRGRRRTILVGINFGGVPDCPDVPGNDSQNDQWYD